MKTLFLLAGTLPLLAQLLPTGSLANIGSAGTTTNLYLASDQSSCSPIYYRQPNGQWAQSLSVGGSGSLICTGTSIDINPSMVPMLGTKNTFTAPNSFAQIHLSPASAIRPACTQTNRGDLRFENKGRAKDLLVVCGSNGAGLSWMQLN